ncbi:hypothetical protein Tco_0965646 [Tanacetum coccineum]
MPAAQPLAQAQNERNRDGKFDFIGDCYQVFSLMIVVDSIWLVDGVPSLDPKSVDGFEELSSKFLEEFSQQKRYDKDPTEIHRIKRKPNEGLQAFMDCFKAESAHIKGVPPVLRIFAFTHGHGHPELAKKLNDKIPKTVDEMWERVRAFIKGERLQTQPKPSDLLDVKRIPARPVGRNTKIGLETEVIEGGKEETWGSVLPTLEEKASHL